jgi:hypothetical protein
LNVGAQGIVDLGVVGSSPISHPKGGLDMSKSIAAEEVTLQLVRDADRYIEKEFALLIEGSNGERLAVSLDGIQVGDMMTHAKAAGMPVEWDHTDGVPPAENTIFELTVENLPGGVMRISQYRPPAPDGQTMSLDQVDRVIGLLRKNAADVVRVQGESLIVESENSEPTSGSPPPLSSHRE